ncbi:MAG: thioredoxin domain-containing protein [Verrucomicrobia bacterium]|nr:thioredoxin domain-containing protein [Verrucomicrobiota bacterium]
MGGEQHTNRLIRERSPYLLQHASNPVDWYPWGEEAFAKARSENKLIFLSIGYSTCHWCHVMEHESFENPAIAGILNQHFVSIKVDREERPDVDRVYMLFVQSSTGSGGWPMSVFLTPTIQPFLGGTYYPPDDRYGRPGFGSLLTRLAEIWAKQPDKIVEQSNRFTEAIQSYLVSASGKEVSTPRADWLDLGFQQLAQGFDPDEGGFSPAPKFPRPAVFNFLSRYWYRTGSDQARDMALFSLQKMANGGVYDHLGGGFHRYSVDARWHVPHFEKMLYDQAQLAVALLEAFQISEESGLAQTARETLGYIKRDLMSPEGGFYSAEDADSLPTAEADHKREGAFYVWTADEINACLTPDEAMVFRRVFGVEEPGNVSAASDPHGELAGQNVLFRQSEPDLVAKLTGKSVEVIEQLLVSAQKKLFEVRSRRPRPHRDDKIVTAWNGMAISAFAKAYQVLGEVEHLQVAQRAADFIQQHLYQKRLLRSYREGPSSVFAFAEDYAFLIQGLLDLYEADFDTRWLCWAGELQVQMGALFADPKGGYFSTEEGAPDILFRLRDDHDGAEPAANSVAAMNLLRLGWIFDRTEFRDATERIMTSSAAILERSPAAIPQMLAALCGLLADPVQVVIATQNKNNEPLIRAIGPLFLPDKIVLCADADDPWLSQHVPALKGMGLIDDKAAAYVCQHFACELPVTTAEELRTRLKLVRNSK